MTAAARAPQSLMAFDFGLRRTGVATGQRLLGLARPLTTVTAEGDARFERIAALVREWQPDALARNDISPPLRADGSPPLPCQSPATSG